MRGHRRVIRAGSVQGVEAGSATVLNPKAIFGSALELWLRADMGITLNAGRVSAWADQSGSPDNSGAGNHHVANGVAGNQPLYNATDAVGAGKPSVEWDTARGDQLYSPVWTTAPATAGCEFIVGTFKNAAAVTEIMNTWDNAAPGELYINVGPNDLHYFQGLDVPWTGEVTLGNIHIYVVDSAGAASKFYQDNLTPLNSGVNPGNTALTRLLIGGNTIGSGANAFGGKVFEVFRINRSPTASELAAAMRYLGARYGISIGP